MLTQIRERATGWLAWVVVILITIPFALWGVQSYFESPEFAPVASVNGEEIPLFEYQRELSERRQEMRRNAGGNISRERLESPALRNEVVQSMVINRLITQYVRERNYRLSDASLKQRIETNSMFLRDGEFDPSLYHGILRSNGMNPQNYEQNVRRNGAVEQLSQSLTQSAFATEYEIGRLLELQTQTRAADYVIVRAARFKDEAAPDAAAVEEYYQSNAAAFEAPARVKVDYIDLSVDGLAAAITPTAEEIAGMYQRNIERYTRAESRKASHILFAVDDDADDETRAATLAEAEKILSEAQGGADFAELAKTHSDDPGSGGKGGDLGLVLRGQMVAPFEDAVFAMKKDEIRGPVKTQYGYHIIKLTDLQAERRQELDEVRDEVAVEVARERAGAQFAELAESFQNLVFESADSLIPAADELGLQVMQSDWFTAATGDGIAAEAAVREAAFSEDVLDDGVNSAALELGFERMLALRKAEHEPAHTRPLDEVRADITEKLTAGESAKKTKALGDEWLAKLRAGELAWKKLLADEKLEAQTLAPRRSEVPADLSVLGDSVFAHAPPTDTVAYNGVALGGGDYAVYALREVAAGDAATAGADARDDLRQKLLARDGNDSYRHFLGAIRAAADISIDQRQLEQTSAYQ